MNRTYDDTLFIDTFEHEYTWTNGVLRNVRRFAERPAVIDPETDRIWTYRELNTAANMLAHALQNDGIGKNDVVMVALRNCPEFAFSYIGPRKIGAILLAGNYNLAAGEMALLIDHNKPKVLIYSANIVDTVVAALDRASHKLQRVVMADNIEGINVPSGQVSYEDYVAGGSVDEPEIHFRPHIYDEVIRLCTSGTTALPKSVPLNDINEVLSSHDVIMHYPLNPNDVCLNMTPWFHRGGCHCGGPAPSFYVGCAVVIMRAFQPHTALEWVPRYHITFLMGAPANLAMLARAQKRMRVNLSGLHGIVTMGAPLSKSDCIQFIDTLTPHIFNGYGTTETFWNSFLRPYDLPEGAGSVGGSCIDDEVRVVKVYENAKAEPDDMVAHDGVSEGEIIIKSPEKTTYSYYNDAAMTKEKFYKGWMYTGDTGTWDEHWFVTVRGRKDDMMVVSGENMYPTQIEEAINEHPLVKDSIVTCIKDAVRGSAVVAYVVPEDRSLTIQDIADWCMNSPLLSKYKRPRYFAIIDEIPRTPTGKKIHYLMKARAEQDAASGVLKKG